MRYGYFDEANKEYVIDRPDTPAPWANYIGSPEYGAIISNNAGGYSFVKSGANGRILRYIFNSFDQPGRYIYLRDNDSKDYWHCKITESMRVPRLHFPMVSTFYMGITHRERPTYWKLST